MNMISGETVRVSTGQKAVSNSTGNLLQTPALPSEYPPNPEIKDEIQPDGKTQIEEILEKQRLNQPKNSESKIDVIENEDIQNMKSISLVWNNQKNQILMFQ